MEHHKTAKQGKRMGSMKEPPKNYKQDILRTTGAMKQNLQHISESLTLGAALEYLQTLPTKP